MVSHNAEALRAWILEHTRLHTVDGVPETLDVDDQGTQFIVRGAFLGRSRKEPWQEWAAYEWGIVLLTDQFGSPRFWKATRFALHAIRQRCEVEAAACGVELAPWEV